jgi:hypothetical protein
MHRRMPGFECAPLAKRGDQDTPQEQLSLSAVLEALISCAVVRENAYALRLSCERHNFAPTNWLRLAARSFLG